MFKRFLKFLKGDEDVIDQHFEGSYFEHILEQVRPTIATSLEECPDHDPTLLLVVNILKGSMPNTWNQDVRSPLVDKKTPTRRPPPPPQSEDEEAEVSDEEIEAEGIEEVDTLDGPSLDPEEVDEQSDQAWSRITEEIDIAELKEQLAEDPERDNTVEMDRNAVESGLLPRVDAEDVLQAGRVYLGLLLENDRLPSELQLTISETALARDLLLGYFIASTDFEEKARKLLTLVEKKFADGHFSQARLLLQLFHTDENTRITNDRNLFYEDMILRLGIKRRNKVPEEDQRKFRECLSRANSDRNALNEALHLADQKCLVKFHLAYRKDAAIDEWTKALSSSSRPEAAKAFLSVIPPNRWYLVEKSDLSLSKQVEKHVTKNALKNYIINHIRTCYFVLRAVGDTGLEAYLDSFFDWTQEKFGINGTTLMPIVYNRSMADTLTMSEILTEIYREFFEEKANEILEDLPDSESLTQRLVSRLKDVDLGEVAPGYYDLGGLIFDDILEFKYPSKDFGLKLHRLT